MKALAAMKFLVLIFRSIVGRLMRREPRDDYFHGPRRHVDVQVDDRSVTENAQRIGYPVLEKDSSSEEVPLRSSEKLATKEEKRERESNANARAHSAGSALVEEFPSEANGSKDAEEKALRLTGRASRKVSRKSRFPPTKRSYEGSLGRPGSSRPSHSRTSVVVQVRRIQTGPGPRDMDSNSEDLDRDGSTADGSAIEVNPSSTLEVHPSSIHSTPIHENSQGSTNSWEKASRSPPEVPRSVAPYSLNEFGEDPIKLVMPTPTHEDSALRDLIDQTAFDPPSSTMGSTKPENEPSTSSVGQQSSHEGNSRGAKFDKQYVEKLLRHIVDERRRMGEMQQVGSELMQATPISFVQQSIKKGHALEEIRDTASQLNELQSALPKAVEKVIGTIHTNRELVHTLSNFGHELHVQGLAKSMLEKHWASLSNAEERDLLARVGDISITGKSQMAGDLPESTYGIQIQVPQEIDRQSKWKPPIVNMDHLAEAGRKAEYSRSPDTAADTKFYGVSG